MRHEDDCTHALPSMLFKPHPYHTNPSISYHVHRYGANGYPTLKYIEHGSGAEDEDEEETKDEKNLAAAVEDYKGGRSFKALVEVSEGRGWVSSPHYNHVLYLVHVCSISNSRSASSACLSFSTRPAHNTQTHTRVAFIDSSIRTKVIDWLVDSFIHSLIHSLIHSFIVRKAQGRSWGL